MVIAIDQVGLMSIVDEVDPADWMIITRGNCLIVSDS